MGYHVTNLVGVAGDNRALAEFLAAFVRDGELDNPRAGDDNADRWKQRMRWWWDENPFCREDSPRGFILTDEKGRIVGFNGLIPFDYEVDGTLVPTLVTTTFFVRRNHRNAVMGLLSRQRDLAKTHQIIDGSPSPEMRRLLARIGYRHSGDRYQYIFPTRRLGGRFTRAVFRFRGWSFPLPTAGQVAHHTVSNDPADFPTISAIHDGKVRRHLSPASLQWLTRIGNERRQFFGLRDQKGMLVAHAIGIYKKKSGVKACLLLDYQDGSPDAEGLAMLLRRLIDTPRASGLDTDTGLISLSRFEPVSAAAGLGRESILHYRLPPSLQATDKACLPFDGDLPLL